jgi:hypothetical protein
MTTRVAIIKDSFEYTLRSKTPIHRSMILRKIRNRSRVDQQIVELFWESQRMDVYWPYLDSSVVPLRVKRVL